MRAGFMTLWNIPKAVVLFSILVSALNAQSTELRKVNWNLPSLYIKDIATGKENVYVATANGLAVVDPKSGKSTVYNTSNGIPDNFITSVSLSENETEVYLGTPTGLALLNLKSGKATVFNRARRQLSDDRVNSVLYDNGMVYIGTSLGVDIYDTRSNVFRAYTAIEGLAGNNIQNIITAGNIVWAGGADGIAYYDRNDDFWVSYGSDNGFAASLATTLSLDADAIWTGTAGGGLGRFDRNSEYFEMFTSDIGLVDDTIQNISDDGIYLWVGTFSGLSRLEKQNLRFDNFGTQNGLTEASVTATAIYGELVFAGTDGAGIFELKKDIPQVSFSYQASGYKKPGEILIAGTAWSQRGIDSVSAEYRSLENINSTWTTEGLSTGSFKTGRDTEIGTLSASSLADGRYQIKISVKDKSGKTNTAYGNVVVDNVPPKIDLFFRKPGPGDREVAVNGRYLDLNLNTIDVYIGGQKVPVEIDRQQARFRFRYPVGSNKKIKVTALDIAGNKAEKEESFTVDEAPPELTLNEVNPDKIQGNLVEISGFIIEENPDQVLVNPGQILAQLTPAGDKRYEFKAQAPIRKEGLYTFQVTASDTSGKTTTKPLTLKFYSEYTIVELDDSQIPESTLRDFVVFTGAVLGPPLKELYLEPGRRTIPLAADKTFNYKATLQEGENALTLVAIHLNGDVDKVDFKVTSTQKNVSARILSTAKTFSTPDGTLRGEYDPGITSILVNGKKVTLNPADRTWTYDMRLKDGANPVTITTVDELSRVVKKTETIYLDNKGPDIFLRTPPAQTGLQRITLRGRISDILPVRIEAFPNISITYYNPENGDFEASANFSEGSNSIQITAVDSAGNRSEKTFNIEYSEKYAKIEEAPGAANEAEILELKRQLEEMRKQLAKGGGRPVPVYSDPSLPKRPSVLSMPNPGKNKSYALAARTYLGSEHFANLIASYNAGRSSSASRLFVPTPELYKVAEGSRYQTTYEQVFIQSSRAKASSASLSVHLLGYYTRTRQLKRIIEGRGYTILLLKNGAAIAVSEGAYAGTIQKAFSGEILLATSQKSEVAFIRIR